MTSYTFLELIAAALSMSLHSALTLHPKQREGSMAVPEKQPLQLPPRLSVTHWNFRANDHHVGRTQIVIFRPFCQAHLFLAGNKNSVFQKHLSTILETQGQIWRGSPSCVLNDTRPLVAQEEPFHFKALWLRAASNILVRTKLWAFSTTRPPISVSLGSI